jgi:hypothetical protein
MTLFAQVNITKSTSILCVPPYIQLTTVIFAGCPGPRHPSIHMTRNVLCVNQWSEIDVASSMFPF